MSPLTPSLVLQSIDDGQSMNPISITVWIYFFILSSQFDFAFPIGSKYLCYNESISSRNTKANYTTFVYFPVCLVLTASQMRFRPSARVALGQARFSRMKQSEFCTNMLPPSSSTPAS